MKKYRKLLVSLLSIALLVGTAAVGAGALTNEKHWVGSWSAGMTDISVSLLEGKKNTEELSISPFVKNMTARIRLTPTLGGNQVRFCLSNENGASPLVIDQASIARAKGDSGAEIIAGSSIPVTFNGSRKVTIPAVSYTHLRAHETRHDLVCRLLLEKKKDHETGRKLVCRLLLEKKNLKKKKKRRW